MMTNQHRATLWMIGWATSFSCAMASNQYAKTFISLPMILWARCAFGLFFLSPFLSIKGLSHAVPLQLLRGFLISLAMVCSYTAYQHLPLHTAAILGMTGPLFVTVLSKFILKESITWQKWGALALGYAGVALILKPKGLVHIGQYELLALSSNLVGAGAILTARGLAQRPFVEKGATLFYGSFVPFIVHSLRIPFEWVTPQGWEWVWLAWIGGWGALSQLCMFSALQKVPASFTSPFEYVRLCFSMLLGWFVFHQTPSTSFYAGASLIIISLLWSTKAPQRA